MSVSLLWRGQTLVYANAIAHRWIIWIINVLPKVSFCIYQPWLKCYQGEIPWFFGQSAARYWIDKDLKESMGY